MRSHRTTISCITAAIFFAVIAVSSVRLHAEVTFPLGIKWTTSLEAPPLFAPGFDERHAYVALRSNRLVAVSLADGTVAWSADSQVTAPPAAGDGLVFGGSEDLIEARSQADGRAQWRRPIQGRIARLHWTSGWLFAATETGLFFALRATDGEILWQRDLGSVLSAPPAPDADRMYLALNDGRILAMSLRTGEDIWTYKLDEPASGILPVGDRLFVGGRDNQLHALRADDASEDWQWTTGADVIGLPVLDDRRVYFIALDHVLRGNNRRNGSMTWKRILPMRPFTGPLLDGDKIIVAGITSELRAYRASDGTPEPGGEFVVKGAENEEVLLAAPPHLTAGGLFVLITKGGTVRGIGSGAATQPAPATTTAPPGPAAAPSPGKPGVEPQAPAEPASPAEHTSP